MASVYKRKNNGSRKNKKWMISWFDAEGGQWRDRAGYTDKDASLQLGRRLETESARRAEGIDCREDEHGRRPIKEHLADFIANTRSGGRTETYVKQLEARISRVITGTGAKKLRELDPVTIDRFLDGLRFRGKSLSGITRNEYVTSIKSFAKWAVEAARIERDPLLSLKRRERRAVRLAHPRRALSNYLKSSNRC